MLKDKKSLREEFKNKRQALSETSRTRASQALLKQVIIQPWYQNAQKFALYLANCEEISTTPLIESLWSAQKRVYLPQITKDDTLLFAEYTTHTTLISNRFGIDEPSAGSPLCALEELEVIFLPLVAFDKKGNRLGMGAGFYDKTLAALKKPPLLLGLAYECQRGDSLPHDVWDVCLDGVVTERHFYSFI